MSAATDPLDNLLTRLDAVKPKAGGGLLARCPGHEDRAPSLSIDVAEDGKLLLRCFANCELEQILAPIGLTPADLFPPRDGARANGRVLGEITATYDYRDAAGTLLYQAVRYDPKDFRQRRPDGAGGWTYSLNGTARALYRLPELLRVKPDETVVVVEGEKDCDRLRREGFVATCHAGGTGSTKQALPLYVEFLTGRHIAIIPDADKPGRDSALAIAQALHGQAASVRLVQLAGLPEKSDVSDWLDRNHTGADLRAKIEATKEWSPDEQPDEQPAAGGSQERTRLKVVRLDTVQEREIDWLWPGWLARSELSIHGAHPGIGKTTFSLALAAAFSAGGYLPDGTRAPIVNTLLMCAEDSLETTIAKGLRLHGANPERIFFSQSVVEPDETERGINLDKHLPLIEEMVTEHDISLVIIDPLGGFTPGKDRNSEGEVRDTLTPLRQLAERHQFGVLGIMHFGKPNGSQRTLLQSLLGSTGFVALARTVMVSAELSEEQQPDDADSDTGRVRMTQVIKSNLDIEPRAVKWRRPRDSAIAWLGPTDLDVQDVLTTPRERAGGTLEQAKAFLQEQLHGGSRPATEIETAATARGISKITLKRAKQDLGVESIKLPNQNGAWVWRLPSQPPAEPAQGEGDQPEGEGDQSPGTQPMIPFDSAPGRPEGVEGDHPGHMSPLADLRQNVGSSGSSSGPAPAALFDNESSKGIIYPYGDPLIPFDDSGPEDGACQPRETDPLASCNAVTEEPVYFDDIPDPVEPDDLETPAPNGWAAEPAPFTTVPAPPGTSGDDQWTR